MKVSRQVPDVVERMLREYRLEVHISLSLSNEHERLEPYLPTSYISISALYSSGRVRIA
jgi:hypothetical protein